LVLRNSFLLAAPSATKRLTQLGLQAGQLFLSDDKLLALLIDAETLSQRDLGEQRKIVEQLYQQLQQQAGKLDPTLIAHVPALEKRALQGLETLEKKLWRAIKRKHQEQQNQLQVLKAQLFPGGHLQERHQHLGFFYAQWGKELIDELLRHSQGLTQEFTIVQLP